MVRVIQGLAQPLTLSCRLGSAVRPPSGENVPTPNQTVGWRYAALSVGPGGALDSGRGLVREGQPHQMGY